MTGTLFAARNTLRNNPLLLGLRNLEEVGQALDDDVNVHIDERHLIIGALVHDGDEGEEAVDLAQHDGPLAVGEDHGALGPVAGDLVIQCLGPRGALEPVAPPRGVLPAPVHLGEVDDDVDVVGTDLIAGHVLGGGVRGDVDLGVDVEEVGLLKAAGAAEGGQHGLELAEARDQLLDDFTKGLEDAVVVDAGEVEVDGGVLDALVG